nr:ESX secretion-associated protein EspG [Amycolatopsis rubida]
MSRTTEVALSALLGAFRETGLEDPHAVFGAGTVHVPPSLADQTDEEARGELSRLGLLRRGRVSDELEDACHVLARADSEYVARVDNRGNQYSALVAQRGHAVVTAVCAGQRVWLKAEEKRRSPAAVLVANLPTRRSASLPTFSLPQHEFHGEDSDFPADRSRAARTADAMLRQPASGFGEITVGVGTGRRQRPADGVLTYRDLAEGRVAFEVSGPASNRYITVMPGDNYLLARKVAALRESIDG